MLRTEKVDVLGEFSGAEARRNEKGIFGFES